MIRDRRIPDATTEIIRLGVLADWGRGGVGQLGDLHTYEIGRRAARQEREQGQRKIHGTPCTKMWRPICTRGYSGLSQAGMCATAVGL